MDNCTLDCIQIMDTCNFVQDQCQQDSVQFVQGYYCILHQSFILFVIVAIALFVLLYLALNALTEHSLTPAVENVISRFKISPTLAGVTFLAFANGAPDVLTAILAGSSTSASTALIPFGSIFGGALFSTAFILSAVIFQSPQKRLKVKSQQILVPLSFYIFGIGFLIIISSAYGKMNAYLSSVLLVAYLLQDMNQNRYIIYVLKNEKKRREQHKKSLTQQKTQSTNAIAATDSITTQPMDDQSEKQQNNQQTDDSKKDSSESQETNPVVKLLQTIENFFQQAIKWVVPPMSNKEWEPRRSMTSLVLSPFILALSQDFQGSFKNDLWGIPVIVYFCVPATLFIIHTAICWQKGWKPIESAFYTIYSFLLTIAWLTIVVGVLINLLELVQLLTNVNPIFLGMTCLAWANSIGDYMSITNFAKRGRAATAVSGIFSGQLFNFLIGFGASLLIQSLDGQFQFDIFSFQGSTFEVLSDSIAAFVIGAGLIYFCWIVYEVIKKKAVFHEGQGIKFRAYYIVFLLIAMCLAVSTDFYQQIACDI